MISYRASTSAHPNHPSSRSPLFAPFSINAVRYYLRSYTQKQVNAFATYATPLDAILRSR